MMFLINKIRHYIEKISWLTISTPPITIIPMNNSKLHVVSFLSNSELHNDAGH